MLRNFVYLDQKQLEQYISQVEDGLRSERSRTESCGTKVDGGADLKVLKGGAARTDNSDVVDRLADTDASRFERLIGLIAGNEDQFGWVDVMQDADLDGTVPGQVLKLDCEVYEPDATKITKMLGAIPLMQQIAGMSSTSMPNGLEGLPSATDLGAMAAFGAGMPDSIVIGEMDDSDWKVYGALKAENGDLTDLEGFKSVVGKVTRVVKQGDFKLLPGLPIYSQMPRAQRREIERKGPTDDQKMFWVEGPALELDILAIFR